jgi:hypothetical protein
MTLPKKVIAQAYDLSTSPAAGSRRLQHSLQ